MVATSGDIIRTKLLCTSDIEVHYTGSFAGIETILYVSC